jgi:cell division protease FtsH
VKNLLRKLLTGFGVLLLVAWLASAASFFSSTPSTNLTLDEIAKKITAGEVKKISVTENKLKVEFMNGESVTSQKEAEAGLTETLRNYGVSEESLGKVSLAFEEPSGTGYWMSMILPGLIPLVLMGLIFFWFFRQAKNGANQAFSFGRMNARLFAPSRDKVTFKDIAGLKEAKEELEEVVEFLRSPKKFLDMGAKIPRGVILVGGPGTGKTMLARATAGESKVPFFHLSASEFVEMFVGVGASRVRDLFQTAKAAAPAIIFIDEIDAVGRERGTGMGGGHDEREQTLNQILVEMDGFDRDTNVIVMAATNRADVLDPALMRPGRFDRRVVLDMPDLKDREEILKIHSRGKPLDKDINLHAVAVRTPGFSGADLANLINEAAIFTARENRKQVTQSDILNSIEKVLLGPARRSRIISEREKKITAYHEAGHALVAASLREADPVHKVSIVSRGFAGGYTLHLPTEDRRLKTRAQFMADIAVAFGGYAAEYLVFKDITTGSSSDIQHATDMAERAVTEFGMSEKLGPRALEMSSGSVFVGRGIQTAKNHSESLGSTIDSEVDNIIRRGLNSARKIVSTNRKILDAIAKELMVKETLEQEEFEKIIKTFNLKPSSL